MSNRFPAFIFFLSYKQHIIIFLELSLFPLKAGGSLQ